MEKVKAKLGLLGFVVIAELSDRALLIRKDNFNPEIYIKGEGILKMAQSTYDMMTEEEFGNFVSEMMLLDI